MTLTNSTPSLVLSQYDWDTYFPRLGKEYSDHYGKVDKKYKGSCDCVWITQNKGLFVIQSDIIEEKNGNVAERLKKAWKKTQKAQMFFQSFMSDTTFKNKMEYHQIAVFPNLTFSVIEQYLCKTHKNHSNIL